MARTCSEGVATRTGARSESVTVVSDSERLPSRNPHGREE